MDLIFLFYFGVFYLHFAATETTRYRWLNDAGETCPQAPALRVRRDTSNDLAYEFKASHQRAAVKVHNEARRSVVPPATDMTMISWDAELASIALAYSQQCKFKHNPSRHHSKFGSVGENLYITTARGQFGTNIVKKSVLSWVNEKKDYNYKDNSCATGKICGHYTQVVWAESLKVGCGATLCKSVKVFDNTWKDATILVCNYGPAGNYFGKRPYKSNSTAATDTTSSDKCPCPCPNTNTNTNNKKPAAGEDDWASWSP